ncbi:MAG: mevalonate kinase [Candidatus Micrarchaeota archaeon]|nr:mevalonate kinase [Candidatus Micrarchaeota archaeon]
MGKGIGHGKVIIFGEHFVVYGVPAIAAGISNGAIVEVKKSIELSYVSNVHGTIPELTTNAIKLIMAAMKIKENFRVELTGDLPTFGGLGSSAAFCVALTRAFADEYNLSLRDDKINEIAYEGEKAFHGNPSGIDNTMATYGGAMRFIRGKNPQENKFEKIKLGIPLHCVIGITGISSPTAKMVEGVMKYKEEDSDQFQNLCDEAGEIIARGEKALATGDLKLLGELMNENQQLLNALGVSIEQNEAIIESALGAGALGAKVTGGGGGGTCLILAKDQKHATEIIFAIKKIGFDAFYTKIS